MTISEKGEDMSIQDKLDAIRFLESVTGHKSQIDDIEYPIYQDKNMFEKDKNTWESWYKKNRCILKDSQIDSLINIYNSYKF